MRKLKWLLPLAIFAPMLMAPSGGYPSHPTFQATGANFSVRAQGADSSSAGVISLLDGQSGNREWTLNSSVAGSGVFSIRDVTAGNLDRLKIDTSGNTTVTGELALTGQAGGNVLILPAGAGAVSQSAFQYFTDNNLYIDSTVTGTPIGGNIYLRASCASASCLQTSVILTRGGGTQIGAPTGGDCGVGCLNAPAIKINNQSVPRISYGFCSSTGSLISTIQNSNLGCSRAGVGSFSVTFTAAYTTNGPSCTTTANGVATNATVANVTAVSTTGATINVVTTLSGAANTDNGFYIICMGL